MMFFFFYLGYKTIQIVVANQATINVKLTEDATTLKEIVIPDIILLRKEQTSSIARMTAKTSTSNLSQMY
jgi:hypothetical protein